MKKVEKQLEFAGRTLTLKTGTLANQAGGAVLAQYGETVVLATVVSSPKEVTLDYFPLSVDYQERLYAGGRIKGSRWVKREGKPTDEEILKGRLIDRSLRPLFPKTYKHEVQIIITVLAVDMQNDPIYVAPIAAAAAVEISNIPWKGPVGVVTVGVKDEKFFINPQDSEMIFSDMDLVVASTKEAVLMIEAGAKEVSEDTIVDGVAFAHKEAQTLIAFINEFAEETGRTKEKYVEKEYNEAIVKNVKKLVADKLDGVIAAMASKEGTSNEFDEAKALVEGAYEEEVEKKEAAMVLEYLIKSEIRAQILSGKRSDGRGLTEIRPLSSMVGVLPRVHGSAVFTRGATQVMTITTLGAVSMGQLIETAEGEEEKRYMHHYIFAPFSTGETGRVGMPGRREIGHGALAERALLPVLPTEDVFPYAIRAVSEVMSSNGSTSMASVCGSTLSLMDAGVPITAPVSGIAMGVIVKDEKTYAIMSDIAGIEDFNGDMDFKVAGTPKGVTALQLDVKTLQLTPEILKAAIAQAKEGRAFMLASMIDTLKESRTKVSTYAPKIKTIKIDPEKIGEVIGQGGKVIKRIIAETGAQVEVRDDGSVDVYGIDETAVDKAVEWVEGIVKEVMPGEIYTGTVVRIQPFGAFVEFLPGKAPKTSCQKARK